MPRARKSLNKDDEGVDAEEKERPKRGKKRKDREEDSDYVAKGSAAAAAKGALAGKRKSVRMPTAAPESPVTAATSSASGVPSTPSLKIRLRLNPPSANADSTV